MTKPTTQAGQRIVDRYGWEDDTDDLIADVIAVETEVATRLLQSWKADPDWLNLASPDAHRRLAEALYANDGRNDPLFRLGPFEGLHPDSRDTYMRDARAILAALRGQT